MTLRRRIERLASRLLPPPAMPEVSPEWWGLARRSPEAHSRAIALSRRQRELWPEREPSHEESLGDAVCFGHLLWLGATQLGGLANLLALALEEA
jgi:hypothetical protein